jgi:hypothetical protein
VARTGHLEVAHLFPCLTVFTAQREDELVRLGAGAGVAHLIGHVEGRQGAADADNGHHHHQLHQGESTSPHMNLRHPLDCRRCIPVSPFGTPGGRVVVTRR